MNNINEELETIEDELKPLRTKSEKLKKDILKLCERRNKLFEKRDTLEFEKLPSSIYEFTTEQWSWILENDVHGSMVKHTFRSRCLKELGFSSFGFYEDTKQTGLSIDEHGFNSEKIKNGFKIIKKSLKPVIVEDKRLGTEIGLRISINGIQDCMTSVLYIHEKDDCALYINKYSKPHKFESFNEFVDWYEMKIKNKNDVSEDY